ncbi:MAG TPA: MG2 domain-containing protein, partial [Anaeromyxobacteraceae bacterium]|nr:MG2 domain-containing protein [Anaeromyxobacteraceae bacterium]
MATLAEGPAKLVGLPPGTSLVSRQWLNLDLGGVKADYSVPGFDLYQRGSGWEERRVTLEPLPPGLYLVQLVQGRVEGQVVLVITDLKVQVKQTDGEVLVRVAGKDLAPVAGAAVRIRSAAGEGPHGVTDDRGEVRLPTREPRLLVLTSAGGDTAVVDTDFYSTLAAAPDVFVYSDRPIYRPGDAVHFRGLVRQPDAFLSRLFTPKDREVTVTLAVAEGREAKARARIDEYGSFEGALEVPADAGTGVVRLTATLDGQPHGAEARVEDYVKPTFYLEIESSSESVRPGETLRAKLRARRFAGGPPAGARYEAFLYRSLVDAPAWVDDAGLGGQGSAVTYGSASTTEGQLSIPVRLYSSVDARNPRDEGDPWASAAALDPAGEADLEVSVPPLGSGDERYPWRYVLSVRVRDDQGAFANGSRAYFLAPSDVVASVRPAAAVTLAGREVPLAVRATGLGGRPYPGAAGRVEYRLRRASGDERAVSEKSFTTGPDGVWRDRMPAPDAGTVVARVTLRDQAGHPWQGEATLLVAGRRGEEIARVPSLQLASREVPLAPGDEAEVVALFPAGWGPGGRDSGRVWVTLTGSAIFESRLVKVEGLSLVYRFPIERRFGSAVSLSVAHPTAAGRWVERTASFRIVPPERVLRVAVTPERAEAEPLGPQSLSLRVTDHDGRGVRAQVSVGVVDRAVYAVQGEFRPRVLEFFYPLTRNNVSTFTSAEFQAYGYGEALARAFGRPRQAFAAVKPPVQAREVDTAYWNPAVVTDEDGRARVTFSLPKNQTLWSVTAVAADASGRFGEGAAEFAARGGTLLVAAVPSFLREGDRAVGSVRVARGERGGGQAIALRLVAEGALSSDPVEESIALAQGSERIVPVRLNATRAGEGRLVLTASGDERPLTDRRDIPVRPASLEIAVSASAFGGGRLVLPVPPGGEVQEVSLALRPSMVALALGEVEDLLTYPYGCLEQLVATTIPDVALYRVLDKAGALEGLDAPARALLSEARSRSVQGIDRILALERPGGGFTWFSGYHEVSVPLTLIALDGLAHAVDAGLLSPTEPRLVESAGWLAAREGLSLPQDATRAYVLARLGGAREAARARDLIDRVAAAGPGDLYPVAMAVLAARRAGIAGEESTRQRIAALSASAAGALLHAAEWRPTADYYDYPLRRAGLTAVLADAASESEVDVAAVRRRVFEALSDPTALSTFDRATVVLHSLWLVERDAAALQTRPPPAVEVEGGAWAALVPRQGGFSAALDPHTTAVRVEAFEGQAELRARVRVPAASAPAAAEGMSVERTYYRLLPGGARRALAPGEKVGEGEEVFVELTLDAHDGEPWRSLRSAYYVV